MGLSDWAKSSSPSFARLINRRKKEKEMDQLKGYFSQGVDGLLDDAVKAVVKPIEDTLEFAEFLVFIMSMGCRRLKALFCPDEMSAEEKVTPEFKLEAIPSLTDEEIKAGFYPLSPMDKAKFVMSVRKADGPMALRFNALLEQMKSSEQAMRAENQAAIARRAQEDADRASKAAAEKAKSERRASEAKRLADEKAAREKNQREVKAQEEREAKFHQYVMCEFVGSKDIVQLATSKLNMIKEFRGQNGITPDWQLAIIRDVAWKCERELCERPAFLPTVKVELEAYINKLDQERKDLQPATSKVVTGAYERQLKLARKVLGDLNEGKVIYFPESGRDGASDTASTEAAQKRVEREAKRDERRERDRQARADAKGPSNEIPLHAGQGRRKGGHN